MLPLVITEWNLDVHLPHGLYSEAHPGKASWWHLSQRARGMSPRLLAEQLLLTLFCLVTLYASHRFHFPSWPCNLNQVSFQALHSFPHCLDTVYGLLNLFV
jgi:hypothetical protein